MATTQQLNDILGALWNDDYANAGRVMPTEEAVRSIAQYIQSHAGWRINRDTVRAATLCSELQSLRRIPPEQPSDRDQLTAVVNNWLANDAPKGMLTPDGKLSPGVADRIANTIMMEFNNVYTSANLTAAVRKFKADVFGPEAAPVVAAPAAAKPRFRGSAVDILASHGVQANTGRMTMQDKAEDAKKRAEAVQGTRNMMQGIMRRMAFTKAKNAIVGTYVLRGNHIDHAATKAEKQRLTNQLKQKFPEFARELD